jgi:phytoene dehydrogenase-like protein
VQNDAAVGVRLAGGETVEADWVVSAGDGNAAIYQLLGGRYTDRQIDELYQSAPTFTSYLQVSLGVARDLSSEPGYLTRVLDTPLVIDPATQLDQVSFRLFNYDPTFAPAGKTAVTCFLPTRNYQYWVELHGDADRYAAEKQRVANAVIAVLERRVPGIKDAIEIIDVSTPATVIRFTGNWKGSMEGWLMTPATGFNSLPNVLPGLERFAMVGQWVQPGGGLPSGLITARSAIRAICREDGVPFTTAIGR